MLQSKKNYYVMISVRKTMIIVPDGIMTSEANCQRAREKEKHAKKRLNKNLFVES